MTRRAASGRTSGGVKLELGGDGLGSNALTVTVVVNVPAKLKAAAFRNRTTVPTVTNSVQQRTLLRSRKSRHSKHIIQGKHFSHTSVNQVHRLQCVLVVYCIYRWGDTHQCVCVYASACVFVCVRA